VEHLSPSHIPERGDLPRSFAFTYYVLGSATSGPHQQSRAGQPYCDSQRPPFQIPSYGAPPPIRPLDGFTRVPPPSCSLSEVSLCRWPTIPASAGSVSKVSVVDQK